MSDGPHRSLPMRRHWKHFAERAATPAYSAVDVDDALPVALKRDFLGEAPLSEVAEILRGAKQGRLFPENRAEAIEAVRDVYPGSVVACTLLDCAFEAVVAGLHGDDAVRIAIERALDAHAGNGCRQIEEHYQRAGRCDADLRGRLQAARDRCAYPDLARDLMDGRSSVGELRPTKRSGVDDGPPL